MAVRLSGGLPDAELNGLGLIKDDLIARPEDWHVCVAMVDTAKITTDTDTGDVTPTVRVRRVEVALGEDLATLQRVLERAFEQRTGKATLPFELEQQVTDAFAAAMVDEDAEDQPPEDPEQ